MSRKLMRVKRGIRRYIVDPGITELLLYRSIMTRFKQSSLRIELYPEFDKYDLLIQFDDGDTWVADVKDWSSYAKLAQSAPQFPDAGIWKKAFLIFPDDKSEGFLKRFMNQYEPRKQASVHVKNIRQFLDSIDRKIKNMKGGVR